VLATGVRQRHDFVVECIGKIGAQLGGIVVVLVCRGVGNGHGAGHGDPHGAIGEALGDFPVVRQKVIAGRYRAGDGWQARVVSALSQRCPGEMFEVDAVQVPAMIVDVVLAPNLAV